MIDRLQLARHLASIGLCVIPLAAGGKRPARKWKRFQTARPTDAELVLWFEVNDFDPAIVTGAVSGITAIDCDGPDAVRWWMLNGHASDLRQLTRRGMHFVYRHQDERNTIRVCGVDGIDRRGEGGYVRAYADALAWTREALDALPGLAATAERQPRARAARTQPRERDTRTISHRAGSGYRMTWSGLPGDR
jgi:hypothetical protein